MRKTYLYIVVLLVMVSVFAACSKKAEPRKLPSLRETYAKDDMNPFGGYVAYRQLENMYHSNNIRNKNQPFDKTWDDISDTGSLYVCMARYLFVSDKQAKAMLDYVAAGNSLFIASNYIDTTLINKIDCKQDYEEVSPYVFFDSMRNTNTLFSENPFSYYYHPFKNSFSKYDSSFTRVLGVNEDNKPNFIVYFHGNGKLFLHCDAKAFSNYFLLKKDNSSYMQQAFAYTSNEPTHLYWDTYYTRFSGRPSTKSSLGEILSHPPLASAFWLILLLLLLYILFGGKRRQRIIKTLKSNENTTVTFTETIGRLYLQQKDNKNIAEKMITYFNEYIRNNYFLNSNIVNEDFITTLSRKSGVERSKVDTLYRTISNTQNNPDVDDYQLLSLNEQIQGFYKIKK